MDDKVRFRNMVAVYRHLMLYRHHICRLFCSLSWQKFHYIYYILSLGILVKAVTLSIDLTSLHDPLLVKQTKESISNCHKCISKMNVQANGSWPWIQTFKSCWKTIFQLYTELAFYINSCLKFCSGKTITQWKYTQPKLEKFLELFVKFCL